MEETSVQRPALDFAALIGIDWADQKHVVCLRPKDAGRLEHAEVEQTPEALADWAGQLRQRFAGRSVAVCLEQSRGALIYALMKFDFLVLYPINPAKLANYRQAIGSTSGAKDDPTDAQWLVDYLTKHRDRLQPWQPDDVLTRQLGLLVEGRRQIVNLRTRLSNALKSQLKLYFPQAMPWAGEHMYSRQACDFLIKWSTLEALQRAKPETIRRFFYAHNCRRVDRIDQLLEQVSQAQPLTTDHAVVAAAAMMVQTLAKQLRQLAASIQIYDKKIQELFAQHPDAPIFKAFDGAGPALAPRLITAFGSNRDRFESAEQVQAYSGIAPVTKRSGKQHLVQRRWACPKFLRQTFHEFADHSRKKSTWAAAYYQMQKAKGKGHHAALRALAFKWIRILFRCWKNRTPYDESVYLRSLHKRHAPLLEFITEPSRSPQS